MKRVLQEEEDEDEEEEEDEEMEDEDEDEEEEEEDEDDEEDEDEEDEDVDVEEAEEAGAELIADEAVDELTQIDRELEAARRLGQLRVRVGLRSACARRHRGDLTLRDELDGDKESRGLVELALLAMLDPVVRQQHRQPELGRLELLIDLGTQQRFLREQLLGRLAQTLELATPIVR